MNHIPDEERHRQVPDEQYDALVDDFTQTLDLEAGLADATRPGRYSAMANDLSRLLDLDTGLAAILAPAETNTSPPLPAPSVEHDVVASDSYATRLSALLFSLEPPTRLRLRADPRYAGLADTIHLALAVTRAHAFDTVRDLARHPDLDLHLARASASDLALARALDRGLDRAHGFVLNQIHAFVQKFNLDLDLTNAVNPESEDLSRLLAVLENVVVDFTNADLRAVSLVGVPLEGIRWSSATTLWPPEWEEQIRAESVETDDGNFVIRGEGRQFAPLTV
ncbi:MAG: hypothetical protein ACRDRA_17845 [Pseudonocardiaceae bacterium]